jgi:hypothetical protein
MFVSAFPMVVDWLGGSVSRDCWRLVAVLCLLTILTMSLVGLPAIWAGLGRGRWFLRAAVVLGCISFLRLIPAFEPVIVYVIQAGLTIIVLGAWRRWRLARGGAVASQESTPDVGSCSPWQFSILDMLLLMAFVAWLSAMLARAPAAVWASWPGLLAEGAATAGLTIAAAWIALSSGRRWIRLPLLLVLFPAAIMVAWLWLWRESRRSYAGSLWGAYKTRVSRAVLLIVTVAILAPVVGTCWRLASPRTFSEPARPNPNGYDELVRAGNLIAAVNAPVFETATRAELKSYVAKCGIVYAPVEAALDKPCQVPLRLNQEVFVRMSGEVRSLRTVGRALYGRGRLAAMEGRKNDAITSYTDTIRLGRAGMQGGVIIDMLVGITLEGMGRAGIAKMRKSLSAEECLVLLPRLKELLDRPALSADVLAREAAWDESANGWQWRLFSMIEELTEDAPTKKAVAFASNRDLAQSRLLLCELAVRAYALQHGRNPATLADLVPSYLPSVPKDPFNGGDFDYRLTPSGYELHSREIGINGQPISVDNPGW